MKVAGSLLGCLGLTSMSESAELLPGTLDMLILKAVSLKPLHGYGVLLRIRQISGDALQIPQGSLYPALYRLEHQGLIAAEWGESDNKRRAKYYTVTSAGRRRLKEETASWQRLVTAITSALAATPDEV
jgi:PadR family transcriptional regulator PadR